MLKEKELNEFLSKMKKTYFSTDNAKRQRERLYHEIIDKADEPIEVYKKFGGHKVYKYYEELTDKIIKKLENKVDYISKDYNHIRKYPRSIEWYDYKIVENNGVNSLLCYSDRCMDQFFTIDNINLSRLLHNHGNHLDFDSDTKITDSEDFQARLNKTEIDPNTSNKCIKLYFSIDEEQIEPFFIELGEEIFENNIECFAKVRMWQSNDQVTVRVYDEKQLDKIYALAKKYKNDIEQEPLMPVTKDGIGITLDNGDSYNAFIRDLFMNYFSNVDDINVKTFLSFIKDDYKKNTRKKLMYQNLFLALNSDMVEITDFKEALKELKDQEIKDKQVNTATSKINFYVNSYLNRITNLIIDKYCKYDLDYARELFMKAINYDGDKVIYSSEDGVTFTKNELLNASGSTTKYLKNIDETFKKLMTLDEIYQKSYDNKGLEGIREITSKRKEYSFYTKYGVRLDDSSCDLFARRNGFELKYNKNGNINTRRFNLDLAKVYEERQNVKTKK